MHEDGVFFRQFQPGHGHLIAVDVVVQADFCPRQTLLLHPQGQNDVGAVDCFFYRTGDMQAGSQAGGDFGQELGRATKGEARSKFTQEVNGGTGHPAVIDVAHNGHLERFQRLLVAQDGVGVEQSLRGMFVHAVAGVDDRNIEVFRHQRGRSGAGMADDNHVRAHRAQGVSRVQQRLAFFDAGSAGKHQRGHRPHRFGSHFKGAAGAGRSFIKQKQHALPAQQGTGPGRIHVPGKFEQAENFSRTEVLNAQQGTARSLVHEGPRSAPNRRLSLG